MHGEILCLRCTKSAQSRTGGPRKILCCEEVEIWYDLCKATSQKAAGEVSVSECL